MNLESRAREAWGIQPMQYPKTTRISQACLRAYAGHPDWEDEDDNIVTINFANSICSEIARLTMLGTKVTVEGANKDYLQSMIDRNYSNLRKWIEYAQACGLVILKPNGIDIDVIIPDDFRITETYNGKIWGAIFINRDQSSDGKIFYTRLEYHRFEGEGENQVYKVSNKCFFGESRDACDEKINIEDTPWNLLDEETSISGLERPLFAVLKTPQANPYEQTPVATPIFAGALQELEDLDVAYSRFVREIWQSKRTVLIDSDRLFTDGGSIRNKNTQIGALDNARANMGLPDFVKAIEGEGQGNIYTEINPTLNTAVRIDGINLLLSQIGYKIGFANGYFVFNQHMGIQTATGVEADQQRTIQFIKDCRDQLESCIKDLVYAVTKFTELYTIAQLGEYELNLDFGDLTYNREEDKARWLTYVQMGKVPFWYYLTKFEGMTEEEAKELEQLAQQQGLDQMMAQQQMLAE